MQEIPKFTLEYFDSQLSNLSKFAIDIDRESKAILKIIAKHGPVSETRITSLGKRRIILSRDIIRYRILKTDLRTDFLSVKKGKKIGNLERYEKLFSLTFKGILASLAEMPLRENFWIKNYILMIEKLTNDKTAQAFLNHIYYHITSFLILHSNKKGMLTNYKSPETDFYDNYDFSGPFTNLLSQVNIKGITPVYKELFIHSLERFFVSSEVIGYLVKNSLKITNMSKLKDEDLDWQYNEILDDFFRRWMWSIFLDVDKTPEKFLESYDEGDEDNQVDDSINVEDEFGPEIFDGFLFMAADEINRIMPKFKIDRTDYVNKRGEGSLIMS